MQARRKRSRHLLPPSSHQPRGTISPSSRARGTQLGSLPETSRRSRQLRRIGSVQLFWIKAVISLPWNCIRITPVPDGPELEQNLKKKKYCFKSQVISHGSRMPFVKAQEHSLILFPFYLLLSQCHVSQRHGATLQYLNETLTHPILSADPPSHTSKYQKQDHQLSC